MVTPIIPSTKIIILMLVDTYYRYQSEDFRRLD